MRRLARTSCRVMMVASFAVVACARAPKATPATAKDSLPPAPTRRSVLLIGTSLTAGYGLDPRESWATRLQQRIDSSGLPFTVVNAGVSGETSSDALHRLDWLLSQGTPSLIVVETGANDALRGQPVDSIRANLDAILARLDSLRPRPVIVVAGMEALPNMGKPYRDAFRSIFPALARAHRDAYLPFLLDGVAGIDSLNQRDGIHPNARGSRIVARNVWRTLGPILDSLSEAHARL